MNEKLDNQLNLAMDLSEGNLSKSQELSTGYNPEDNSWDLIVRYGGNVDEIKNLANSVKELGGGYAIVNANKMFVDMIANLDSVIYVEKPKSLEFAIINGKRSSCINQVQIGRDGLFGEGVFVAIIDSGIDYTNNAFIDENGNTRIYKLYDQVTGVVYDSEEINQAIGSNNPYELVNSRDLSGHGTHVAGIAAGNNGVAPKSKLLVVKMNTERENSFPRTTELMEAIDFVIKEANKENKPVAINISFGNTYGSHDGTSLLSTYIDYVADRNRTVIAIGTGNEGDSGGHTGGYLTDANENVELEISRYEKSLAVQIWKDYVEEFDIQVIAPSGERTQIISKEGYIYRETLGETDINILYGTPRPYSRFQEIYISLTPQNIYLNSGIWIINLIPRKVVNGRYDMWLPARGSINKSTRFLKPDPDITLTIPSGTNKAISVGAYNSYNDTIASFSGRGFTREKNQVKPDIVAPGVNIVSASNVGGTNSMSGTSMATPFVTGGAALMMEWGIVRGNDRYLYGEKVKAYMIRGARKLPGLNRWPNKQAGWGALCLEKSFPQKML